MTPIDLIPFAEHSEKVPFEFLAPTEEEENSKTGRILISHFIDFGAAFMLTSIMGVVFSESIKLFMVTTGLKSAFSEMPYFNVTMSMFPLTIFAYFFFSYLLNHGQTLGMFLLKKRMEMESNSISDAFRWSTHSFLLCLSGGMSYLFKKSIWNCFKSHDYLYDDLVAYRDLASINLLTEAEKNNVSVDEVQEEVWKKVA